MRNVYSIEVKKVVFISSQTCTNDSQFQKKAFSAGILEQSMGARNRVGIELSYLPPGYIGCPVGIDSLESILGLLKSLKIRNPIFQTKILKRIPSWKFVYNIEIKKVSYLFSDLHNRLPVPEESSVQLSKQELFFGIWLPGSGTTDPIVSWTRNFKRLRRPGIGSASLCSLTGRTTNRVVVPARQDSWAP